MSKLDPGREWINRHVASPVVSYDWEADVEELIRGKDYKGFIPEWRLVRENIVRRRRKLPTDSELWKACETAIGLWHTLGEAGMGHQLLIRAAEAQEARGGPIDPLVQAVIREAMDEAFLSERFERA